MLDLVDGVIPALRDAETRPAVFVRFPGAAQHIKIGLFLRAVVSLVVDE
jgi:hypothetical protein